MEKPTRIRALGLIKYLDDVHNSAGDGGTCSRKGWMNVGLDPMLLPENAGNTGRITGVGHRSTPAFPGGFLREGFAGTIS